MMQSMQRDPDLILSGCPVRWAFDHCHFPPGSAVSQRDFPTSRKRTPAENPGKASSIELEGLKFCWTSSERLEDVVNDS